MASLKYLIIHCTATPEGREVTSEDIYRWHTAPKPKGRGWSQVGYSEMIHLDGTIEELVPYNDDHYVDSWEVTNGARGMNYKSRHIVYVGGVDKKGKKPKDTRTQAQKDALEMYVKAHTTLQPQWKICAHYHWSPKACPSFDVEEWLKEIGVNKKNIYTKKPTVL